MTNSTNQNDVKFFNCADKISLTQLAKICGAKLAQANDIDIVGINTLQNANSKQIAYFDNPKYLQAFKDTKAGACFIKPKNKAKAPDGLNLLISDDPYRAFAKAIAHFYPNIDGDRGISDKANISSSAIIGKNAIIEAGAYVGDNVVIGDNCYLGANSSISYAVIGDSFRLLNNASIGQSGFGYAMGAEGHLPVKQVGSVEIGNNVEIGANTCVDRGAIGKTKIGSGTKIDNLVQIAHNVEIGNNCIITAMVGIAGSTKIGNFVVIGGNSGIAGHTNIGDGVQIAAHSGITKDVAAGQVVGGAPAKPIREWHKTNAAINRLVSKIDKKQ